MNEERMRGKRKFDEEVKKEGREGLRKGRGGEVKKERETRMDR